MKPEQLQQAEDLYIKTNLTKTEIAQILGISRTTLHNWAQDMQWDRIRNNVQHMPIVMAENMYFVLGKVIKDVLSEERASKPVTVHEANMISKLGNTIKKFSSRNTLNETIELRNHFMDYVQDEAPEMIGSLQPLIDGFLRSRARTQPQQPRPANHSGLGQSPVTPAQSPAANKPRFNENRPDTTPTGTQPTTKDSTPATDQHQKNMETVRELITITEQLLAEHPEPLPSQATEPPKPLHILTQNQNLNRAQRRELERNAKKKNQAKKAA